MPDLDHPMSIGGLSRATGVPESTLRTWERRYGFPSPERTQSGHRRYSMRTLERLRLVKRVLELGHRPAAVLQSSEASLRAILRDAATPRPPSPAVEPAEGPLDPDRAAVEAWLGHVERFEGRALERELSSSYAELGAVPLLERRIGPFVNLVGERWEQGQVGVGNEHFASERLREFLTRRWRPLSDAGTGPTRVLATLPGERHVLGLHMAALVLAIHDTRVVMLGAESPPADIAATVEHHSAEAVVLSASSMADPAQLRSGVANLRQRLAPDVEVVGGGVGFAAGITGAMVLSNFSALGRWACA